MGSPDTLGKYHLKFITGKLSDTPNPYITPDKTPYFEDLHMTEKKKKAIKKLSGWAHEPTIESPVNETPTGQPVSGPGFEKVLNELLVGYKHLYDNGLSTSMIAVLAAHYGGTTIAEATAVFTGLKLLKEKLEYKGVMLDMPEID